MYFQGIRLNTGSGTGRSSPAPFHQYPSPQSHLLPWKVPAQAVQGWAPQQPCTARELAVLRAAVLRGQNSQPGPAAGAAAQTGSTGSCSTESTKARRVPAQEWCNSGPHVWGTPRDWKASGFKQGEGGFPTQQPLQPQRAGPCPAHALLPRAALTRLAAKHGHGS